MMCLCSAVTVEWILHVLVQNYCVYTMMEHYSNVIVDLEVVDKREAGRTSTLMEKMGCKPNKPYAQNTRL